MQNFYSFFYVNLQNSYAATMSSPGVSDPYAASSFYPAYLSYPTVNQGGLSEGVWSNGDQMYMGGYGQMNNDMYSGGGVFGGFDYTQMGFAWQYPGGEYSAWGTPAPSQPRKDDRGYMNDHYYLGGMGAGMEPYSAMNGEADGVKAVEQGLRNVSVGEKRETASTRDVSSSGGPVRAVAVQPTKQTWASVAGKPANQQGKTSKLARSAVPVRSHGDSTSSGGGSSNNWDNKNSNSNKPASATPRTAWSGSRAAKPSSTTSVTSGSSAAATSNVSSGTTSSETSASVNNTNGTNNTPVHDYNPKDFNMNPKGARFFVIKSYSEDDIHRSIKYGIWCSTDHGNKRLDGAFRERESKGPVYLFFSVNGSGHFCGMAQMVSPLDYNTSAGVWAQDKWKGRFEVKWIYVKDVPNSQLRHIRLENNENKPVTNSRDTQEVPPEKGKQMLRIIHQYRHTTSIFDDFIHYEKRQEEMSKKVLGYE